MLVGRSVKSWDVLRPVSKFRPRRGPCVKNLQKKAVVCLCQILLGRPAASVKLWPPAGPRVKVSNFGRPRGPYYPTPTLVDLPSRRAVRFVLYQWYHAYLTTARKRRSIGRAVKIPRREIVQPAARQREPSMRRQPTSDARRRGTELS